MKINTALLLLLASGCATELYTPPEKLQQYSSVSSGEARNIIKDAMKKRNKGTQNRPINFLNIKFEKEWFQVTYEDVGDRREFWCRYKYDDSEPIVAKSAPMAGIFPVEGPKETSYYNYGCYPWWEDRETAERVAGAWRALKANAQKSSNPQSIEKELDHFRVMVGNDYTRAAVKPALPENARKFKVQAEAAVQRKEFEKATKLYGSALEIAPWWPDGHFNRALLLGESADYREAILEMRKFLILVPEGKDARSAQDKIYVWEGQME